MRGTFDIYNHTPAGDDNIPAPDIILDNTLDIMLGHAASVGSAAATSGNDAADWSARLSPSKLQLHHKSRRTIPRWQSWRWVEAWLRNGRRM